MRHLQRRWKFVTIGAGVAGAIFAVWAGTGMTGRGQERSTEAAIAALAAKAGIVMLPIPHLEGSAPLYLPHGIPRPVGMAWPKHGSIFVEQLREENTYWRKQIAATPELRDREWQPDYRSVEAYRTSLAAHRQDLRRMLGLVKPMSGAEPTIQTLEDGPVRVDDVRLEVAAGLEGRALVLVPAGKVQAGVVAIPDARESREQFVGLARGEEPATWLKALLGHGVAVAVLITVERTTDYPYGRRSYIQNRRINRRQLLYRLGFIVGRTLLGLEVEQAEGWREYLERRFGIPGKQTGVLGWQQGGMTALYAGAMGDWGAVSVVDYFQTRENCWKEPVDRMLYGQLKEFGDAEVAGLVAPTPLEIVYTAKGPTPEASVEAEAQRVERFYRGLKLPGRLRVEQAAEEQSALAKAALRISKLLGDRRTVAPARITVRVSEKAIAESRNEHFEAWHEYLKKLDAASGQVRREHWKLLETPQGERVAKAEELRKALAKLMGTVPVPNTPLNPRTHLIRVTDKFVAFDVLLDALPGVHAYGQLLVPRGLKGRLPVVICQHGLGGRPADMTGIGSNPDPIYHALGAHLADLGYVVFSPYLTVPIRQEILVNPLVREAAALGMMRTSLELAKLHRIIDFLDTQPYVDPNRIAYYGLSYGGYSAIWMPPLEPRIKASVISGHFNDWRLKITDEGFPGSYLRYQDADFYNWNVLNRFTHLELTAAMYPRPVCVEFGQQDPTTTPEWHARAWAQVEAWKKAWGLDGLNDRVTRVHFEGPHEVHGVGTFAFLNRFLRPDLPGGRDHSYNLIPQNIELSIANPRGGLATGQNSTVPLVTKEVDGDPRTRIKGRFYVSKEYPEFSGMELQLSRVGNPGDLIVRFGSSPDGNDLGEARVPTAEVDPMFDLWYSAKVKSLRLDPSKLYYFEVTASSGRAPHNCYVVYGPKPLGGTDELLTFGLSFRVLAKGEPATLTHHYERFGFMQKMLSPYGGGPAVVTEGTPPRAPDETVISRQWSIYGGAHPSEVVETAAKDLSEFFKNALSLDVKNASSQGQPQIRLLVAPNVQGLKTEEGYRIAVSAREVRIEGTTPRGVMRGVYALEDGMRERHGALIKQGVLVRNVRFSPRIATGVHEGGRTYDETSYPMIYTDGLLDRISHSGFNAIWVWLNTEEATLNSKIYPELDDLEAATRLARLEDLAHRAKRYGIDVYIYLGTGYNHHIPESFFKKHPDARGYGWGPPLCTSNATVRRYYAETVQTVFGRAPDLKGMIVIYDSEGFWYCGNNEHSRLECPRCRHFSQAQIAAQLLTTLDKAMHVTGGPHKQFIAWNYNVDSQWIVKMLPLLPKDIVIQGDFDKGMVNGKDGIRHQTEDYNISNLGPPALFINEYSAAQRSGLKVMAKTEHAISQEFIFVPYIPCMGQWYRRISRMRDYNITGFFGNWDHYGYTPSIPADLINQMSFDPAPTEDKLLNDLAAKEFGPAAAPYVVGAWHNFSRGIREFPYSDPVARLPGPLQKGPSQPLFLDPYVKGFGPWRSWQNNLNWTRPWGPRVTAKYLSRLEELYANGNAELETARRLAPEPYRSALASEWRVGETIQYSVQTVLHLIKWIELRKQFFATASKSQRAQLAVKLEAIALKERANAKTLLPLLQEDSRLGYAAISNGGLFTPSLVEWKIGFTDDVLLRQLPEALKKN